MAECRGISVSIGCQGPTISPELADEIKERAAAVQTGPGRWGQDRDYVTGVATGVWVLGGLEIRRERSGAWTIDARLCQVEVDDVEAMLRIMRGEVG